jgi:uncharacterized integral membrane protein
VKSKLIAILVIALLALVVLLQNRQPVTLRFIFWSVQTTQIFLVALMLVFGFVMGFIAGKFSGRPRT